MQKVRIKTEEILSHVTRTFLRLIDTKIVGTYNN